MKGLVITHKIVSLFTLRDNVGSQYSISINNGNLIYSSQDKVSEICITYHHSI